MQFSIFSSLIDLSHHCWKNHLKPGDWVIDATCGNGQDTLFLAKTLSSFETPFGIIGIDLQQKAIENTRSLLDKEVKIDLHPYIHLFHQSHTSFPSLAKEQPISLIVYNLGYLPGGDKSKTTLVETTLESLCLAQTILRPGGLISVHCYPGHKEGEKEEEALLAYTSKLPQNEWHSTHHRSMNRRMAPSLLLLQKKIV